MTKLQKIGYKHGRPVNFEDIIIAINAIIDRLNEKELEPKTTRPFQVGDVVEMSDDCINKVNKGELLKVYKDTHGELRVRGESGDTCCRQFLWRLITPAEEIKPTPEIRHGYARNVQEAKYILLADGSMSIADMYIPDAVEKHIRAGSAMTSKEFGEQVSAQRRSMVPTCEMPKVGDRYWTWTITVSDLAFSCVKGPWFWAGSHFELQSYKLGRVFLTEGACRKHMATYSSAWTSKPGEYKAAV